MHTFKDPDTLAEGAAEFVASAIERAVQERGRCSVCLVGGSTPRPMYRRLASPECASRIDTDRTHWFFGDERPVPPNHPDSNYRVALGDLLSPLGVPDQRVHRMPADAADLDAAAHRYAEEIARLHESDLTRAPPRFDLILLGLGDDGHTASLFPHTHALVERERWIVPNHVPNKDATRMTVTMPLINRARLVLFLVSGPGKAAALARTLEGPRDPESCPAQAIDPTEGELHWWVDADAAAHLAQHRTGS